MDTRILGLVLSSWVGGWWYTVGMRFYYTIDYSHARKQLWDGMDGVPVMVVASNYLSKYTGRIRVRRPPEFCKPLFADCGGFYFALKGKDYPFTYHEYDEWLYWMAPNYAASWDYPCESEIVRDDAAILDRQAMTIEHAYHFLSLDRPWMWVPVLQGRTVEQYINHARMYADRGLSTPYMGIGSLCRRTRVSEIGSIVRAMHDALPHTGFHLFGVKSHIFGQREKLPPHVYSADSGAWNGMYGAGREMWREAEARGLSQDEYEIREALPRYKSRLDDKLSSPKQMTLI